MLNSVFAIMLFVFAGVLGVAASDDRAPLSVVPSIDLSRYDGKWFEIARLPNSFQKKCSGEVTATYERLDGGKIRVTNECRLTNGKITRAEGLARPADKDSPNSKLKVRFAPAWLSWLPQVWGDYWVIELAPDL